MRSYDLMCILFLPSRAVLFSFSRKSSMARSRRFYIAGSRHPQVHYLSKMHLKIFQLYRQRKINSFTKYNKYTHKDVY